MNMEGSKETRPYQYCPKCQGGLSNEKVDAEMALRCQNDNCRFIFWHNPSPTVAVVIKNEDGKILLTRRNIEPGRDKLDLPGGFMRRGETAEDTAIREIREELGVEIVIESYITTVPDTYDYQGVLEPTLNIAYLAEIVSKTPLSLDKKEIKEVVWLNQQEISPEELAFFNNVAVLRALR